MTADDIHALIERWRARDEQGAVAYFAPDGEFQEAGQAPLIGREAMLAHWGPFFHGGPDFRVTAHDVLRRDDRLVLVYTWDQQGKDGSWKSSDGVAVIDVRDGKIARWREYKA